MKNRRIDIIVKYFYPVAAGIETNIMETYSVLQKNGWDVNIHTTRDTLTSKNTLAKGDSLRGLDVLRYPSSFIGFVPNIDWKNADLICLHNFNVFPHFFIMLYTLGLKLFGRKKFKLILTPHGGFNPEWSTFPVAHRYIKKLYHYTLGALLINLSVDCVRAVSEWEKNEIIIHGVTKEIVKMIPNGIENEAYINVDKKASQNIKDKVAQYGRYIIQVGRIYPIKNYETTIKSMVHIPKDVKYIIVGPKDHIMGKEDYEANLKKLAKDLGVSKRVIFAGVLRGVDKYYIIKHAQMMVHMALWESFCNVVHEGLSQGFEHLQDQSFFC